MAFRSPYFVSREGTGFFIVGHRILEKDYKMQTLKTKIFDVFYNICEMKYDFKSRIRELALARNQLITKNINRRILKQLNQKLRHIYLIYPT